MRGSRAAAPWWDSINPHPSSPRSERISSAMQPKLSDNESPSSYRGMIFVTGGWRSHYNGGWCACFDLLIASPKKQFGDEAH